MTAVFQYNPERPQREETELYLQYWGKEDCVPGHPVGPGVREIYKIHFIHKGKGHLRIGEQTYSLGAGQAFLIFPHIVTYYEADQADPWTYSWVGFVGTAAEPALSRAALTPQSPIFPMDVRMMPGLYEQLKEAAGHEASAGFRLQSLLYELLSLMIDMAPQSGSEGANANVLTKKQDAYVHQSMEYIHAYYCYDISVQQLADSLGLDRKYLSALFKESLGVPPQQYLLRYRMDKACELLAKGTYTVGEVARSVGYQDALLFSRMFKKTIGVSPKAYLQTLIHK